MELPQFGDGVVIHFGEDHRPQKADARRQQLGVDQAHPGKKARFIHPQQEHNGECSAGEAEGIVQFIGIPQIPIDCGKNSFHRIGSSPKGSAFGFHKLGCRGPLPHSKENGSPIRRFRYFYYSG